MATITTPAVKVGSTCWLYCRSQHQWSPATVTAIEPHHNTQILTIHYADDQHKQIHADSADLRFSVHCPSTTDDESASNSDDIETESEQEVIDRIPDYILNWPSDNPMAGSYEHRNKIHESIMNQRAVIRRKLGEYPGTGIVTDKPIALIPFKWNKRLKYKRDCDTLHMLYLLQLALESVRLRTIERNDYFKSMQRIDRYLNHLDNPQVITNFMEWHRRDPQRNKFHGALVEYGEKLHLINNVISEIGNVSRGPATKIWNKLKKEITIDETKWLQSPQPVLELQCYGLSVRELVVIASGYFRVHIEEEFEYEVPKGLFNEIARFIPPAIKYQALFNISI